MVGAKTVTSLVLVVAAALLVALLGPSDISRLARLGPWAAFSIGAFASIAGALVMRYGRLHEPSRTYFRPAAESYPWGDEAHFIGTRRYWIAVGENHGEAFDLGPVSQLLIYVGLGLAIGVTTLDSRAVEMVRNFPHKLTTASTHFCPDEGEEIKTDDPEAPGCALIRRAYALGYAKSLGPCEKQDAEEADEICTLRQRDEPLLHYAWRLLDGELTGLRRQASPDALTRHKEMFVAKTDHLQTLYEAQRHLLAAGPRASHHIWTNLPPPRSDLAGLPADTLAPSSCVDRFRRMPHQPRMSADPRQDASRSFEHVVGQLIFDSVFGAPAGYCKEYTFHWNAPVDACARLAQQPTAFLADSSALADVQQVMQRYQVGIAVAEMKAGLPDGQRPESEGAAAAETNAAERARLLRAIPMHRFVSFQCYMEEKGRTQPQRSSGEVIFDGHDFRVDAVHAPESGGRGPAHTARYAYVGSLMAPSFRYGKLMSNAPLDAAAGEPVPEEVFEDRRFFLARLGFLSSMDIYLGDSWLLDRNGLLEVYPYHVHLQNFVGLFRLHYQRQRGRL